MRRGVGASRFSAHADAEAQFKSVGSSLKEVEMQTAKQDFHEFQKSLQTFAIKHRKRINDDPIFRKHFMEMCASIGVDPLISSQGFWSKLLGVGSFYNEVGTQVLTIAMATREQNGGVLTVDECQKRLVDLRGSRAAAVDRHDVERAVNKLKCLGEGGLSLITLGGQVCIASLPDELQPDQRAVLEAASYSGMVTCGELEKNYNWEHHRADAVLATLLREGLAWIDASTRPSATYYFPSIYMSAKTKG